MGGGANSDSGAPGGRNEDIRAKLARYQKERQDFEVIRQQFRKKNSELGINNSGAAPGKFGGNTENTPVAGQNYFGQATGGSHKLGGANVGTVHGTVGGDKYGSAGNADGNNIFAMGENNTSGSAGGHV